MYEIGKHGKIVVDSKEVYYGCVIEFNIELRIAKLNVIDWRDKELHPRNFRLMVVPISAFTIKYDWVE